MNPSDRDRTIAVCLELLIRCGSGTHSLRNAERLYLAADADGNATLRAASYTPSSKPTPKDDPGCIADRMPATGHHDPTGDAATNGTSSPGARAIAEMDRLQRSILTDITRLDLLRARAFRAPEDPRTQQKPVEGCRNCSGWRTGTIAPPGGLCQQCRDFKGNHKCLPTEPIVRRWDVGLAATPGMLIEARAAAGKGKRRKSDLPEKV